MGLRGLGEGSLAGSIAPVFKWGRLMRPAMGLRGLGKGGGVNNPLFQMEVADAPRDDVQRPNWGISKGLNPSL